MRTPSQSTRGPENGHDGTDNRKNRETGDDKRGGEAGRRRKKENNNNKYTEEDSLPESGNKRISSREKDVSFCSPLEISSSLTGD